MLSLFSPGSSYHPSIYLGLGLVGGVLQKSDRFYTKLEIKWGFSLSVFGKSPGSQLTKSSYSFKRAAFCHYDDGTAASGRKYPLHARET